MLHVAQHHQGQHRGLERRQASHAPPEPAWQRHSRGGPRGAAVGDAVRDGAQDGQVGSAHRHRRGVVDLPRGGAPHGPGLSAHHPGARALRHGRGRLLLGAPAHLRKAPRAPRHRRGDARVLPLDGHAHRERHARLRPGGHHHHRAARHLHAARLPQGRFHRHRGLPGPHQRAAHHVLGLAAGAGGGQVQALHDLQRVRLRGVHLQHVQRAGHPAFCLRHDGPAAAELPRRGAVLGALRHLHEAARDPPAQGALHALLRALREPPRRALLRQVREVHALAPDAALPGHAAAGAHPQGQPGREVLGAEAQGVPGGPRAPRRAAVLRHIAIGYIG
mmetsp:Transcript_24443/g.76643  ORF Transcript_24443/g.76643 Transcript_24443/m.76643 type:complete len:333 (-) Transcript_24443:15-1013(-)